MGNRKGVFLLLFVFLCSISLASAANFTVKITPILDTISTDESAKFELVVNNLGEEGRFTLLSRDPKWSLITDPLTHFTSGIKIGNHSEETTIVMLTPNGLDVGSYRAALDITSANTKETKTVLLDINIGEYIAGNPVVKITLDISPQAFMPETKVSIKIGMENKNALNLQNLTLIIKSSLINEQRSFKLTPFDQKTIELTVDIGSVKPVEDTVTATVKSGDQVLGEVSQKVQVLGSSPAFKQETITAKSFLKSIDEITITNQGNLQTEQTVKIPTNFLKRLFTSTEPASAIIKEDGKKYIAWNLMLSPGENTRVVVTRDYRTLSSIIALIIAAIAIYYIFRPSIVIEKIAVKTIKTEEGIKELSILLKVKNRRNKPINKVKVEDFIPNLSELVKEEYVGTLAPTNVFKQEYKGTVIKWDIGDLEGYEERLLKYRMKSRLSIIGSFFLPQVKVEYEEEGKKVILRSAKIKVSG